MIILLYLVCPDVLITVGETSYGIRMSFIGSDEVLAIFLFIYLYLRYKVNSYPVKQTKSYSTKRKENNIRFPPKI